MLALCNQNKGRVRKHAAHHLTDLASQLLILVIKLLQHHPLPTQPRHLKTNSLTGA